jgi:CelD/BcsL family acetyltransferase involved in cellulose biosynthesis
MAATARQIFPAAALPATTVEIVADMATLARLEPAWNDLVERAQCRNVFLTFDWIFRLWSHGCGGADRLIVVLRDDDRELVAIAPLAIDRVGGLRRLGVFGGLLCDAEDFICLPGYASVALAQIFEALVARGGWDYFQLGKLRDDSPNFSGFADLQSGWRGGTALTDASVAPFARIEAADWTEHWETYDSKWRRDTVRRRRKLAEEVGPVCFVEPASEMEVPILLDELISFHQIRRGKRDFSLFVDPRMRAFFHDYARAAFRDGRLSLVLMRAGETTAAAHLAFIDGDRYRCLLTGFRETLMRYAPGRLIVLRLIERCYELGLTVFDLGYGGEAYKFQLVAEVCPLRRLTLCRPTVGGGAAHLWIAVIRPRLRRSEMLHRVVSKFKKIRSVRKVCI